MSNEKKRPFASGVKRAFRERGRVGRIATGVTMHKAAHIITGQALLEGELPEARRVLSLIHYPDNERRSLPDLVMTVSAATVEKFIQATIAAGGSSDGGWYIKAPTGCPVSVSRVIRQRREEAEL